MPLAPNDAPLVCELLSRDADDNHVLAAAQAAGAEVLLTGDQDLLVLGAIGTCRIVAPRDMRGVLAGRPAP